MSFRSVAARLFKRLKSRDKRALITGCGLLAAIALLMSLESRWQSHVDMNREISARKTDLKWISQQMPIVASLQTSCNRKAQDGIAQRALLTMLIRRNQLQLDRVDFGERSIELTVSSGNSNDILRLVEQLACEGLILTELDIEKVSKPAESLDYQADLALISET